MRSAVSMLMNFVLALVFIHAPFLHVHEHGINQHHPHDGFFHVHIPHHHLTSSKSAEVQDFDPDDDASYQDWVSIAGSDSSVPMFLLVPAVFSFTPVTVSESYAETLILSGHDPPQLSLITPRGPPV